MLPQAFGMIVLGGLLLDSAFTGRSLVETVRGVAGRGFSLADFDIGNVVSGSTADGLGNAPGSAPGGTVHEVFYDPLGQYWDSGKVNPGGIGNHSDHVHVAADGDATKRTGMIGYLMKAAPRYGCKVSSAYRSTSTTFHGRNMAADIVGSPANMRRYAQFAMAVAKGDRKPPGSAKPKSKKKDDKFNPFGLIA